MGNARNLSKFKPSSSGLVETADIADDAVSTDQIANDAVISTSGAITTTGAFTSVGIDDNADATTITLDANEDITASNGMYVSGDLTSLTVDKGGIDRTGNTTRIISARSGGNYADMSINIAGVDKSDGNSGMNRCLYIDYQGNTTIDQGNLVIGTSGKGIDFSGATDVGTGETTSSSILNDYEEGTFSVAEQNSSLGMTLNFAEYTKIGRAVHFILHVTFASGSDSSAVQLTGMPFDGDGNKIQTVNVFTTYTGGQIIAYLQGTTIFMAKNNATVDLTYSDVSGKYVRMSGTYQIL